MPDKLVDNFDGIFSEYIRCAQIYLFSRPQPCSLFYKVK